MKNLSQHALMFVLVFGLVACNQHLGDSFDSQNTTGIINGQIKTVRDTPASKAVVMIELLNARRGAITFCTATLIGAHTILTASHCFDPMVIPGLAGFRVLFENTYTTAGQREVREGLAFVRNPDYNSKKVYDHDIAIGVFAGTIPQGFSTVAIDNNINANYSNMLTYAYGYGRTVDYTGAPNENLRYSTGTLYRGVLKIDNFYKETPDRYYTLVDWPSHLCQGDSGGPQFYDKDGVLKVIGVNSASFGEKLPNGVQSCMGRSQATKVAPFFPWIKKEEKRLLQQALR
ncbi:trypsin-like serine protease [Bdellovibrio sp. NC01]|uniref:S1 family peptidase n=1 Tax=Bdellovibrio sp. NC01 TaxID=2220073 RepID=UPI001159EECD|nr:trypsin-like serine protease [Bdellovibrio sp. NC01]QDK36981.1 trypsin [Bdellovibrio sp. NC01]